MALTENIVDVSPLEPANVLQCLFARFDAGHCYTHAGPMLVAINPFATSNEATANFQNDAAASYQRAAANGLLASLPPHIFAVAAAAASAALQGDHLDQSIIVSGESAAGKTFSTRLLLAYLTTVSSSTARRDSLIARIEACSPVLEAFGNAATTINHNSSRFGKLIRLVFDLHGSIQSASIDTYLLERTRITNTRSDERNFHIFYQLMAGASDTERAQLHLEPSRPFALLGNSSRRGVWVPTPGDPLMTGKDDNGHLTSVNLDDPNALLWHTYGGQYETTRKALECFGIDCDSVAAVVAAILHLGNTTIVKGASPATAASNNENITNDNEGEAARNAGACLTAASRESVVFAATLLGLDPAKLTSSITTREMVVAGEHVLMPSRVTEAQTTVDSLCTQLYASLFAYVASAINGTLSASDLPSMASQSSTVGLLDIFGFENFAVNTLEQLCINYANEKLQCLFVAMMIEREQQVYEAEGLAWQHIAHTDRARECLALIAGPSGIIALLQEECQLARDADAMAVTQRMRMQFNDNPAFPSLRIATTAFAIAHYAQDVVYDSSRMAQANREARGSVLVPLLPTSTLSFVRSLGTVTTANDDTVTGTGTSARADDERLQRQHRRLIGSPKRSSRRHKKHVPTVLTGFKNSLGELMGDLEKTQVHFIRCIRSNKQARGWTLDRTLVGEQVRACGVLEATQVCAQGYASKLGLEAFEQRYGGLVGGMKMKEKGEGGETEMRSVRERVCVLVERLGEDALVGRTRVFLRDEARQRLERMRVERWTSAAVCVQAVWKGWMARRKVARRRWALVVLQRQWRKVLVKRRRKEEMEEAQRRAETERLRQLMMKKKEKEEEEEEARRRAEKKKKEKKSIVLVETIVPPLSPNVTIRSPRQSKRSQPIVLFDEAADTMAQVNSVCAAEVTEQRQLHVRSGIVSVRHSAPTGPFRTAPPPLPYAGVSRANQDSSLAGLRLLAFCS